MTINKKKKKNKPGRIKAAAQVILIAVLVLFGFSLGTSVGNFPVFLKNIKSGAFRTESISAGKLKKLMENKDFVFINVHTPYEGEIEQTDMFVEYDSVVANKMSLPKDLNTKIVLYCKTGNMSGEALGTLKNLGYRNATHLKGGMDAWNKAGGEVLNLSSLPDHVLPDVGFELPVSWGDMGPKLISLGVIDKTKFLKTTQTSEQKNILEKITVENIKIDSSNAQFVVNMLWAFGLAQKSKVYDEGPLGKEYKSRVGNFASTGGWTLARGKATDYLNKFDLIELSPEEQDRVAEISKHVYRPCCGNATWFPDCNHGMAALAAIELMVDKGLADEEIYKNVLKLNSFWFSSHYMTIATYFARQGTPWDKVDAKLVLGEEYSSGQAAQKMLQKVGTLPYEWKQTAGGCGV